MKTKYFLGVFIFFLFFSSDLFCQNWPTCPDNQICPGYNKTILTGFLQPRRRLGVSTYNELHYGVDFPGDLNISNDEVYSPFDGTIVLIEEDDTYLPYKNVWLRINSQLPNANLPVLLFGHLENLPFDPEDAPINVSKGDLIGYTGTGLWYTEHSHTHIDYFPDAPDLQIIANVLSIFDDKALGPPPSFEDNNSDGFITWFRKFDPNYSNLDEKLSFDNPIFGDVSFECEIIDGYPPYSIIPQNLSKLSYKIERIGENLNIPILSKTLFDYKQKLNPININLYNYNKAFLNSIHNEIPYNYCLDLTCCENPGFLNNTYNLSLANDDNNQEENGNFYFGSNSPITNSHFSGSSNQPARNRTTTPTNSKFPDGTYQLTILAEDLLYYSSNDNEFKIDNFKPFVKEVSVIICGDKFIYKGSWECLLVSGKCVAYDFVLDRSKPFCDIDFPCENLKIIVETSETLEFLNLDIPLLALFDLQGQPINNLKTKWEFNNDNIFNDGSDIDGATLSFSGTDTYNNELLELQIKRGPDGNVSSFAVPQMIGNFYLRNVHDEKVLVF